jgi:hypothetical protein
MKTYGKIEVKLHAFVSLALDMIVVSVTLQPLYSRFKNLCVLRAGLNVAKWPNGINFYIKSVK